MTKLGILNSDTNLVERLKDLFYGGVLTMHQMTVL